MNILVCTVNLNPCPENAQQWVSMADLVVQAISAIEPSEFAAAYAFGAGSVVTWWALGFGISSALKAINKA